MARRSVSAVVPLEQIDEGTRYREDYKNLDELAQSIKERGQLLQPLVVKRTDDPDRYELAAGGRRLRACKQAGLETVMVEIWPQDTTELEMRIIERTENACREDLTWQEEVKLTREIERLQAEEKGTNYTQDDIAQVLHKDRTTVAKDLQLAEDMENIPELADCKTKKEAITAASNVRERILKREIAKRINDRITNEGEDKLRRKVIDSYVLGFSQDLLQELDDCSFDLIDLDPPYAISNERFSRGSVVDNVTDLDGYKDLPADPKAFEVFIERYLTECYRVLKTSGWVIAWHSVWYTQLMYDMLTAAGFIVQRAPLIWSREESQIGATHSLDTWIPVNYDVALYARKAEATLNKRGRGSIFSYKKPDSKRRIHQNEKPVALMEDMLQTFVGEGSKVLVPFCGSGNTLFAAYNLKMEALGFDLSSTFKEAFILRANRWTIGHRPDEEDAVTGTQLNLNM